MIITVRHAKSPDTVIADIDGVSYHIPRAAILARDGEIPRRVADWLDAGNVIGLFVPPTPSLADFDAAIRAHIDTVAGERDFDSATDAAAYTQSTQAAWSGEALAFIAYRDAVWLAFDAAKDKLPATVAEFISGLPAIVWPQS